MAAIFNGLVSTENIEKFFLNLIVSDFNMPHTSTHLSPITFTEFLSRNQVLSFNMFDIYDEACKAWVKFCNNGTNVRQTAPSNKYDFDMAEKEQKSWHPVIDYLRRFLYVEQIDAPYFQMHYISLVCRNFYKQTELEGYDASTMNGYRLIWNQIINPILYDPLVPANYFWLPIENFTDIRFTSDLLKTCERIKAFLDNHSHGSIDYGAFDQARLITYRSYIEQALTAVYQNKYNEPNAWAGVINTFFSNCRILELDLTLFEMYNTTLFLTSDFKSIDVMKKIDKMRKRYEKGYYNDDAESLVDDLLGALPIGVKPLQDRAAEDDERSRADKFNGSNGYKKGDGGDHEAQHVKA